MRRASLVAATFGVVLVWLALLALSARAEKAPRFLVGQTYLFVWQCFPEPIQGCYMEPLTVHAVYDDGLLSVTDIRDDSTPPVVWTANPAQAIEWRPYKPQNQRRASLR